MNNLKVIFLAILVFASLVSSSCFREEIDKPDELIHANSNPLSLSHEDLTVRTFTGISSPRSITYDGVNLWVANMGMNTVTKISENGTILGVYRVGNSPKSLAFDGKDIWVANSGENTVSEININTLSEIKHNELRK